MYAFRSNTELVPVFQITGTLVPFGIPLESCRNVPPRCVTNANTWEAQGALIMGMLVHRDSLAATGGAHKEAPVEEFAYHAWGKA
jgi:hypothetical protein